MDKKRKKINIIDPKIIEFYENNVENFSKFKNLLIMKAEADEYMKKIKLNDETLKKMKYIKKKYQLIKKEMKKFLYPNQELYLEYYEEWKRKSPKFAIPNYELKDLIDDIKYLIPNDEKMTIIDKDNKNFNKNFSLILYLFQKDYFLKDYI